MREEKKRVDERRSSWRVEVDMWVEGTTAEGDCYFQRSGNLSSGGIYLDRAVPHKEGTRLMLKFSLPGDTEDIKVLGEILSHHDTDGLGMGVKFLDITDAQRKKIEKFIEENKK
ncbi:MAG: hypothetical protein Kow0090_22380 [Myxococcota bacterium]